MPEFNYKFNRNGANRTGNLSANSKEEAIQRLKRMDISPIEIGEVGQPMESLVVMASSEPAVVQTEEISEPPKEEKGTTFVIDSEEDGPPPPQQRPFAAMDSSIPLENIAPQAAQPFALPSNIPPTLGTADFRGFVENGQRGDGKPKPKEDGPETFRKQSFLYGTHKDLATKIAELMDQKLGEVKFLEMNSDMRKGEIVLAIVIEHDIELP